MRSWLHRARTRAGYRLRGYWSGCGVRPIAVHHIDLPVAVAQAGECDSGAVQGEGRVVVRGRVVREIDLVRPVRVHQIDFHIAVTVALEGDLSIDARKAASTGRSRRSNGPITWAMATRMKREPVFCVLMLLVMGPSFASEPTRPTHRWRPHLRSLLSCERDIAATSRCASLNRHIQEISLYRESRDRCFQKENQTNACDFTLVPRILLRHCLPSSAAGLARSFRDLDRLGMATPKGTAIVRMRFVVLPGSRSETEIKSRRPHKEYAGSYPESMLRCPAPELYSGIASLSA